MATTPSANLKVFTGAELTAQDFAIIMENLAPMYSGVLYGCECSKQTTNVISVAGGWVMVRGRLVRITEGLLQCPIGAYNGSVLLTVNLTNSKVPVTLGIGRGPIPADDEHFNENLGIAYFALATFDFNLPQGGILNLVNTPTNKVELGKIAETSWYTNALKFHASTPDGVFDLRLKRVGNVVYSKINSFLSIPWTIEQAHGTPFDVGQVIPQGYKPSAQATSMYMSKGHMEWLAMYSYNVDGMIQIHTNFATSGTVLENMFTSATWITNDAFPT